MPPSPWIFTIVAVISISIATKRFFRLKRQAQLLKLGRDGEKAVGEFLERLRGDGYAVFHNLVGDNFNVDHVLIDPTGVATSMWCSIGGFKPDRDPVIQGRAQASWLCRFCNRVESLQRSSLVITPATHVSVKSMMAC